MRTVYASATSMWKLNNSRYRKAHSALFIPDNNELVRQREYLLSTTGFHLRVLSRPPSLSLSIHPPFLSGHPSASTHPISVPNPRDNSSRPSLCLRLSVFTAHILSLMTLRRYGDPGGGGGEGKIVETRVSVCVWTGMIPISRRITIIRREGGENEVSVRNLVKGVL